MVCSNITSISEELQKSSLASSKIQKQLQRSQSSSRSFFWASYFLDGAFSAIPALEVTLSQKGQLDA